MTQKPNTLIAPQRRVINTGVQIARNTAVITQSGLAFLVGYLLLLTGAAAIASRRTPPRQGPPTTRFLILVPAHNEARLLPSLLTNLKALNYPGTLYTVYVVADNCTDNTADIARQHGAIVHERTHKTLRGKGYALQWLLERLDDSSPATNESHHAIVFLDADSVVSENFLTVMDARLSRGERAIQAYYAVGQADRSRSAGLRYAALAVLHYLRPQGRMVLGGSAGLKGNGMVFTTELVKAHTWSASLTEDIEFHMNLILAGERVTFAPDAIVWAEMPDTLADSQTQNIRWERGRLEMVRNYVPQLLQLAWQRRSFLLFDAAIEQLIPPFSVLAGTSILSTIAAILLSVTAPLATPRHRRQGRQKKQTPYAYGVFLIAGQVIYLLAGLLLARAPKHIYLSLLSAPQFIIWKLWLYGRVLLGRDQEGWIRTKRNEEHQA